MISFLITTGSARSLYKLINLAASIMLLLGLSVGIIFATVMGFVEVIFLIPNKSLMFSAKTLPDRGMNMSYEFLARRFPIICDTESLALAITSASMKLVTGVLRIPSKIWYNSNIVIFDIVSKCFFLRL